MMEREPGDLRTGILVIGAFVLLVAGIIWGASSSRQDLAPLYAEFPALAGVSTETPVLLNGFRIGQVDAVEPRTDSLGHLTFRVRMLVQWHPGGSKSVPYRQGMKARLVPPPVEVIGTALLKLEPPAVPGPPLARGATLAVIPYVSPLEGAQARIDSLGNEMTRTLSDTRNLLATLGRTATAATGAATATAGVANTAAQQITVLATDTRARLAMADSLMRDVRSLTPSAHAAADSLQAVLGDSRRALVRLSRMADNNEPQLTRTLASLDTSSALLQHFMREISARPLRVFTGVSELKRATAPAANGGRTATSREP